MSWDEQLDAATEAWRDYCRTLETTGADALAAALTHEEIGDPTSTSGGVPGGNAVTARWVLGPVRRCLEAAATGW